MKVPAQLSLDGPALEQALESEANGDGLTDMEKLAALDARDDKLLEKLKTYNEIVEEKQAKTHERMIEMMDRFDKYHEQMRGDAGL